MSISNLQLEQQLLDSDAGRAVYDALVQANIDLRSVSLELIKDMLTAEYHHRRAHVLAGFSKLRFSECLSSWCRLLELRQPGDNNSWHHCGELRTFKINEGRADPG